MKMKPGKQSILICNHIKNKTENNEMDEKFLLENELLHDAIWGEADCKLGFTGYVYSDKKNLGRAFIEYCICRIFNIHRLPGCGYDRYNEGEYKFYDLEEDEVTAACNELKALYDFTQEKLSHSKRVENGKIELVRSLRNFERDAIIQQLEEENEYIEIPVNVFTSYAHDGNMSTNYPHEDMDMPINIKEKVDIKDILLWDSYVEYKTKNCDYLFEMGDCENEVWVMDRRITGWKTIPRSQMVYDKLPRRSSRYTRQKKDLRMDNTSVMELKSNYSRPCMNDDWFTKKVMAKNIKDLEKQGRRQIGKVNNDGDM